MNFLVVHGLQGALNFLEDAFPANACESARDWRECIEACNLGDYSLVLLSSMLEEFPPELLAFFINYHVRRDRLPLRFVLVGPRIEEYSEAELAAFGIIGHIQLSWDESGLFDSIKMFCGIDPIFPTGNSLRLKTLSRTATSLHQALSSNYRYVHSFNELKTENDELIHALKFLRNRISYQSKTSVISMITAAEARDPYMRGHIGMVEKLSVSIGKMLKLSSEDLEILSYGALIHDVGKIGIPDKILNKRGELTTEETSIIRSHPVIGVKILEKTPAFSPYLDIVLNHHERLDGSGYPDGRSGDEIPFLARIVSVADVVSALITDRPYRSSVKPGEAAEIVLQYRGITLDADAIDAISAILTQDGIGKTPSVYNLASEYISLF